jgi:hypothetical protein
MTLQNPSTFRLAITFFGDLLAMMVKAIILAISLSLNVSTYATSTKYIPNLPLPLASTSPR